MQNAITTLRIQNFKSIKDVTMQPRRVNIIIGEPNVGKSNILEAMSLLGGMVYDKKRRFMDGMVRYEKAEQLFFDNLVANTISVKSNREVSFVTRTSFFSGPSPQIEFAATYLKNNVWDEYWNEKTNEQAEDGLSPELILRDLITRKTINNEIVTEVRDGCVIIPFDKNGRRPYHIVGGYVGEGGALGDFVNFAYSVTRPYFFSKGHSVQSSYSTKFLEPPMGDNLKVVIQTFLPLRREIAKLFASYGLKLLLHMGSKQMEVIKDLEGVVYSYPYSSIADTLQRLIFYLAAIESNDDAVLLFEEPEAHSYPVYVSQLAQRMVESRNNQFFVVTHSPYLITEVLENMLPDEELAPELALFVAYYEDYQTKVRQLSDEEVRSIRRDSLDVFYNMARFVPRPSAAQN